MNDKLLIRMITIFKEELKWGKKAVDYTLIRNKKMHRLLAQFLITTATMGLIKDLFFLSSHLSNPAGDSIYLRTKGHASFVNCHIDGMGLDFSNN